MSQNFIKTKEDFICAHCARAVEGNGYTNHCPACLWSRHVDNVPGDRAAECGGLMRPASFTKKGAEIVLLHQCESCGHKKPNKLAPEDNLAVLEALC